MSGMYTRAHTNDIDDTYTGRFPNTLLPVFSFDHTLFIQILTFGIFKYALVSEIGTAKYRYYRCCMQFKVFRLTFYSG